MTALALRRPFAESLDQLFEPIRVETLGDLFKEYENTLDKMRTMAAMVTEDNWHVLHYFTKANISDDRAYIETSKLFTLETAVKVLDAEFWQRALALTDVYETMPQARKDEWHKQIERRATPPFEPQTVLSTLQSLLDLRQNFFAERVDGVFRALSHTHVTNRPEGFSKRMILNYVFTGGYAEWSRCGVITDLRTVIAKFMGRPDPIRNTSYIVEYAGRECTGKWVDVDGGALRIRVYLKGTAHIEVHPEIAWRLNSVLAHLYPTTIPDMHRTRPKTRAKKEYKLFNHLLPFAVLELLQYGRTTLKNVFMFSYGAHKSLAFKEAKRVLEALGGTEDAKDSEQFIFTYPVDDILRMVQVTGMIPDTYAHQFYPTPPEIAEAVATAANVGPNHTVLEPSAGQGHLADMLPANQVTCVEVASLHCHILRTKGYADVIKADFLDWSPGRRFDRILMNPPFTKGQWIRHLEHAATLLASGGILVAVLPASASSKRDLLQGYTCTFSEPIPFPGTSIEVTIMTATRGMG